MLLIVFYFVLSVLTAECTQRDNQEKCATGKCDMVSTTEVCTKCKTPGNVPIDGVCVEASTASGKCEKAVGGAVNREDTVCGKCLDNYFMYRGGCYLAGAAGPGIGTKMCETAESGKCTAAAKIKNFFVPPTDTDATHDSVVWCGDAAGLQLGGKTYTGVADCATCDAPTSADPSGTKAATCHACRGEKLVKTVGDVTSCVTEEDCAGAEGFFVNNRDGKKCSACADTCKTCKTAADQCTSCKPDKPYLKKDDGSETGTCVDKATCPTTSTHYIDEESKTCTTCTSGGAKDCKTCEKSSGGAVCKECPDSDKTIFGLNKKSCVAQCPVNSTPKATKQSIQVCMCEEGFQPNAESTECQPTSKCVTPGCKTCDNEGTDKEVCTACLEGKYLTPTNQCIDHCITIAGYYDGTDDNGKKTCKKCNSACAECVGAASNQCSACPARRMLQYTDASTPAHGGTCVDQCSVSTTTEGCAECGARIGGTDYCSKCKGSQVPINGVCAANPSARAAACTSDGQGACTSCTGDYFLRDGGCYKTDRLPGKSICTQAANGQCNKCANDLVVSGGNCGECHPTCATCSAAGAADKCKTCVTGYYKTSDSEGSCKKCSEGLAGCRQCTASIGGKFICLEMGDGTTDDGSTNRSGLTTGAIAGIAVAVVIVVGGLVGFLCWWFLCRGKA
ncbi:VSP [Giardia lamblia P15]|uniref:VSP n=1 Tax=Giardia intestinalis (strain P15) TaxID=658858 RepID=E1F7W8_GIAIA|nr:VSP [Giardia lamblia P15]